MPIRLMVTWDIENRIQFYDVFHFASKPLVVHNAVRIKYHEYPDMVPERRKVNTFGSFGHGGPDSRR